MRERHLPKSMRRELREFFENARRVREVNDDSLLLSSMSPLLQGTVAYAANRQWLAKIWWLQNMGQSRESREFIASLAKSLQVIAYVASERPPLGQLYVMRKGMTVKNWRFMRAGSVWGDDLIIEDRRLMDHSQAVALTYIEVFALSHESMDAARDRFTEAGKHIYKAALRFRIRRALLLYFCRVNGTNPRSFVPEYLATGYFFIGPQLSTNDKIDALHDQCIPDPGVARSTQPSQRQRPMPMVGTAQSTDARLDRLTASVESLTSSMNGLTSMLQGRFDPTEKQRAESMRRARQPPTTAHDDDELAPLSSVEEKSRPPQQMRRAATASTSVPQEIVNPFSGYSHVRPQPAVTAGTVVDRAPHRVDQVETRIEAIAERHAAMKTVHSAPQVHIDPAPAPTETDATDALPQGWYQTTAPDGHVYFYHATSGATQWLRPTMDLDAASSLSA
jgi:hypothetical protein